MRHSSIRHQSQTSPAAVADAADSSCGDSGISGASGCASPTQGLRCSQQQQQPLLSDGWQFHAMAMSAISELPSPLPTSTTPNSPTTAASAAATAASSRLTQSVSYGRGASAQARRQALAHSLAMLSHETRTKQKELDRRELEVQEATAKATEQIEYVLKMSDKAHKLEDENAQLRSQLELCKSEISNLLDELQQREAELQERDDYCQELRQQLGRSQQDIAQIRSCADQLKVENSVLNDTCRAVEGLPRSDSEEAELEQLRLTNQRLQRQLAQADTETSGLLAQMQQLQQQLQQQQQQQQQERQASADQTGGDSRSKRELLQTIRRLVEEKMAWEAYCARLLRRAVECAPQLLLARPDGREDERRMELTAESRWEAAFSALFRTVMQKDPRLVDGLSLPSPSSHPVSPPPRCSLRPPRASTSSSASAGSSSSIAAATTTTQSASSSTRRLQPRPILPPTMRSARQPAPAPMTAPGQLKLQPARNVI
ncbi:hypothetical protein BOX15_Mlig007354g1 [Macrostomum lignano]|uniref:Uncharacterized protein n=2 Tax=Macrostomum lignano TaxID=282301 RepID=A0A267EJQ9_9PLAT|nr:hypothetical protein BOX15_Mlig007354g1 [Macrostomum lignano]